MATTGNSDTIHMGRNIKRFREMLGIKQEALAYEMGDERNQKKVSLLEAKETIEPDLLEQVAKILKVPVEAIKNFDEEAAIHNIQNNYDSAVINAGPAINYKCTFNPIEKIVELYEALVKSEKEKVEMFQKMLDAKK